MDIDILRSDTLGSRAREYVAESQAGNTTRAYRTAWRHFEAWCQANRRISRPADPGALCDYLADCADDGVSVSTLGVRLAAISKAHAGMQNPVRHATVEAVMSGIRRSLGTARAKKAPAVIKDVERMIKALKPNLPGLRDRALILIGFAGAFRRSELVGLTVNDLRFDDEKLTITLRRSKTDQEGHGLEKHIARMRNQSLCPVRALRRWLDEAEIRSGPVFRPVDRWANVSDQALTDDWVARIVKRTAKLAGLDPDQYSGHSLRAGFVTSASEAGKDALGIMEVTGHTSVDTVAEYQRSGGRVALAVVRAAFGE